MILFLNWGRMLLNAFLGLEDFLNTTFEIPLLGEISLIYIALGAGLSSVLMFRAIKFVSDIVL